MDKFVTKTAKRPAADDGRDTSTAKKAKSVERPESPAVGECTWEEIGTVLYMCNFAAPSCGTKTLAKIAALDLDSTLISTKSGKTFPTDAKDWKFWNECVPTALRNVVADGYQVVVFSNQSGLSKGRVSATELKTKINAIAAQLNMPLRVFLMSSDDIMRKPRIGAWTLMLRHCNLDVDLANSFYCGDAAGRPKAAGKSKKDFSCADYKFALNVGIAFSTPERFFLKSTLGLHCNPESFELGHDPRSLLQTEHAAFQVASTDSQELVVLVGSPASGKSSFCKAYFSTHGRINQDTLKTLAKCKAAAQDMLSQGKSVVIDNTNRDIKSRAEWIAMARDHNVPVRAFYLDLPKALVFHLKEFRMLTSSDASKPTVPDMVIHGFFKNVQVPTVAEGFASVVHVPFVPLPHLVAEPSASFVEQDKALLTSFLLG
ncbi:polynucleotide kinase 3'-phosphatase [Aphanomyces invadans]|uniref:Polynucleotide kinase 3'-phosphatase n=1 Tax=Aphanomyces invadans TaxID=157072 RepID=A0A024TXD6_9STRA|nr:polynucleotide kinase 3'-phosphatase [Aphanomyces invadans]ETV98649.1 polynucleotide kinase 3'-phosphatase [Aphanomyces invadans]|eukprot:XP_008872846.1 polynucleotide kinase 3'-phosphatase [Aphanomyces invadans]